MIRPRLRKVLSDLWNNRVRSLLVIASITVGLFAVGMITSIYFMISSDMRASYRAVNPANVQVSTISFDTGMLEHIQNMEGVRDAEGIRQVRLRVRNTAGDWTAIEIKAIDDIQDKAVNRLTPVAGSWPPADQEIVVEQYKLPDLGVPLGGELEVKLPSGKVRRMKLAGVVQDQTVGASGLGGGFFLAPVQGYITFDTLPWLEQPSRYNTLLVTAEENVDDTRSLGDLARRVTDALEDNGHPTYNLMVRRSIDHPNSIYVEAIAVIMFLLGILVVFLSAFLITNTLSALLKQQTRQIGIMKTVGGRRYQITGIYMLLILVFSLLALAIALPLSSRAAYGLVSLLAGQINFRTLGFHPVPEAILLQVVIALFVPQAAGIFPILRGTHISIQDALSGIERENAGDKKSRAAKAAGVTARPRRKRRVRRPLLIALRNTFRSKARLALTLITLTLGGAIFIATFNVRSSLDEYIQRLNRYFIADVAVTFDRPYRSQKVEEAIQDLPGVVRSEAWGGAQAELVVEEGRPEESVHLLAPPAGSTLIEPIQMAGRWLQKGDENAIVVNETFLTRFPGMQVGDSLRLKIDGEERDWTVVGIIQMAGKSGGYVAYTTYEYLSRITHSPFKSTQYRIVARPEMHNLQSQKQLSRMVEDRLEERGFHVSDVDAGLFILDRSARGLNIITGFLLMMAVLTALVGSIGLAGTMSMNVLERTREIGIMRAIGASDRAIMQMVIVEGLLIGLVSWLLGCVLAFPISKIMSDGVSIALFNSPSQFAFTLIGFAVWLALAVFLSVAASYGPARNAARLTVREVLAYE